MAPSISRPPSPEPSSGPSVSPSVSPTGLPSALPTYIGDVQASFAVEFNFDNPLGINEADAFETATSKWVSFIKPSVGSIDDVTCDVFNQVIRTEPQNEQDEKVEKYLEVFFLVHVEYTGTDTTFDLFELLNDQFQNRNANWVRELASEDTLFQSLIPTSENAVLSDTGAVLLS